MSPQEKVFRNVLVVSPFGDGTYWYLREPLRWFGGETPAVEVVVPAGFVTDFASVPRVLWWLFSRWGKYGNAAVVHDWLYWSQQLHSRKASDLAIAEGMDDMGVGKASKHVIYRALWLFGGRAWRSNERARAEGRKRCIGNPFPIDPKITWEYYEKDHGVDCLSGSA